MKRKYTYYTKELLENAVRKCVSYAAVLRFLGKKHSGSSQSHLKTRIVSWDINTSHFTGQAHSKGTSSPNKKPAIEILILNETLDYRVKSYQLKRSLIEIGRIYKCECCDNPAVYNKKPLKLHIDHINGNWYDNRSENLRFLCPNCHSQTTTFGGRNKQ